MVIVDFNYKFEKTLKKIKNKEAIKKQIRKIINNPEIGKPMRYGRKGTRESYLSPYRISYTLIDDKIVFLELYHKDLQ